jgi:hypothetical protein
MLFRRSVTHLELIRAVRPQPHLHIVHVDATLALSLENDVAISRQSLNKGSNIAVSRGSK